MLASLVAAAQKDDQRVAVSSEVHAISGAERQASLHDAITNWFHVSEISFGHSFKHNSDAGSCVVVKSSKPTSKWVSSLIVVVFAKFDHHLIVT